MNGHKRISANPEAYVALAIAICERAMNDYRLLLRCSDDIDGWWAPDMEEYEKRSIEDFFLSQFGDLISFGHGEEIMKKLWREEACYEAKIPFEYRV